MDTILLVDDEQPILTGQQQLLELNGFTDIYTAQTIKDAKECLELHRVDLILLDLTLNGESGEDLLQFVAEAYPDVVVLVVTGTADVSTAVACMKAGAHDFLVKGTDASRIPGAVRNALDHRHAVQENALLREAVTRKEPLHPDAFSGFLTQNEDLRRILVYLDALATLPDPILVTGETGVGKELIARGIHTASARSGDFVPVNLGGVDDHIFSDTLFGHRAGAFTGASSNRHGMVKSAADGTLFLDEIGEMTLESQVRLLRLLDSGEFLPLGSDRSELSRARIVCATNRDLSKAVDAGTFRRDLYYRISTHKAHIPPLRSRPEDIGAILDHLLAVHAERLQRPIVSPPEVALALIRALPLPGNVRELQQLALRVLIEQSWDSLFADHPGTSNSAPASDTNGADEPMVPTDEATQEPVVIFGEDLPTPEEVVESLLREADRRHPESRSAAASAIGLSPQAFANRWKRMSAEHRTGKS